MSDKEIIHELTKEFPSLNKQYLALENKDTLSAEKVVWQLFIPFIKEALNNQNTELIKQSFSFIEKLIASDDKRVKKMLKNTFFLAFDFYLENNLYLLDYLGEKTNVYYHFLKEDRYQKNRNLNQLLIQQFPQLLPAYNDETSWKDGDDTGSHIVYESVFIPYIIKCMENNHDNEVKHIFHFIEEQIENGNDYTDNVMCVSVLEGIEFELHENPQYFSWLGEKSQEFITNWRKDQEKYSGT